MAQGPIHTERKRKWERIFFWCLSLIHWSFLKLFFDLFCFRSRFPVVWCLLIWVLQWVPEWLVRSSFVSFNRYGSGSRKCQPIIWTNIPQKLNENENNWTKRSRVSLKPPSLKSVIIFPIWHIGGSVRDAAGPSPPPPFPNGNYVPYFSLYQAFVAFFHILWERKIPDPPMGHMHHWNFRP